MQNAEEGLFTSKKLFSILILFEIKIYIYGTESKLPAYLQIPSILSNSFNSVLAVEVWLLNFFSGLFLALHTLINKS